MGIPSECETRPQVAATGRRADRERKAHDPAREAILDAHENGAKSPQRAAEKRRRRALITALKGRHDDDKIEVLDAAYWMKGCSSLGRLRYAVLVGVADGEPNSNNLCLIDIKEGVLAAAPRAPDAKMPRDNAERVVAGGRVRLTWASG